MVIKIIDHTLPDHDVVTDAMLTKAAEKLLYYLQDIRHVIATRKIDALEIIKDGDEYTLMIKEKGAECAGDVFHGNMSREDLYKELLSDIKLAKNRIAMNVLLDSYLLAKRFRFGTGTPGREYLVDPVIEECRYSYTTILSKLFSKEWRDEQNIDPLIISGNIEAIESKQREISEAYSSLEKISRDREKKQKEKEQQFLEKMDIEEAEEEKPTKFDLNKLRTWVFYLTYVVLSVAAISVLLISITK